MRLRPLLHILLLALALVASRTSATAQAILITSNTAWRYLDNGSDQGTGWSAAGFDDSGWSNAVPLFGADSPGIYPWPIRTPLPVGGGRITYYFRTHFQWHGSTAGAVLTASNYIDDGAVFYLNGAEAGRVRMPASPVNFNTLAINQGAEGTVDVLSLTTAGLVTGDNVLAVEVHQTTASSSDVAFGLTLERTSGTPPPSVMFTNVMPTSGPVGTNVSAFVMVEDISGVVRAEFFLDGQLHFQDDASPYASTFGNLTAGLHTLIAVAYGGSGLSATSAPVIVTITNEPGFSYLVRNGSVWKYLDNGSNQGTAWRQPAFNDNAWKDGQAELGFGDIADMPPRPERTAINGGPATNRIVTTYFRHTFNVPNPGAYSNLIVQLMRDDGGAVYLNDVEVFRSNMDPVSPINFDALTGVNAPDDGTTYFSSTHLSPARLVAGNNVLAVEIHQSTTNSSDLSFDLMLLAQPAGPEPPRLDIHVWVTDGADLGTAQMQLEQRGAVMMEVSEYFRRLTCRIDPSRFDEIVPLPFVRRAEPALVPEAFNLRARYAVNAINVQPAPWGLPNAFNLTGAGVILGVWDGGTVLTHPDFLPRLTVKETCGASTLLDGHAAHVIGTMAGDGSLLASRSLAGVAPAATIYAWSFRGCGNTVTPQTEMLNARLAVPPIVISQNSWGYVPDAPGLCWLFGAYAGECSDYDKLVRDRRLAIFFAAGNRQDGNWVHSSGGSGSCIPPGFSTVLPLGTAKNVVTVGAIDVTDTITVFSSLGPTDDGRLKPDVVAFGQDVQSAAYLNFQSTYDFKSGTSMAAPAVSGTAALLVEQFRTQNSGSDPTPALLKAVLCNTATDLGQAGPDFKYGYGKVNAVAAATVIQQQQYVEVSPGLGTGGSWSRAITVPAGCNELKVLIAWSDREYTGANPSSPTLVNDLDLTVIGPGSGSPLPLTLNPGFPNNLAVNAVNRRDNVEQFVIGSPAAGVWTIQVGGFNVPQGPQPFAVTWRISCPPPPPPCPLQPIAGLFNTGVDNSGAPLAQNAVDPHYTLVASAVSGAIPGAEVGANGAWLPNTSQSQWIGPDPQADITSYPKGTYTYRLQFNLACADLATAKITGRWAVDDWGEIKLNGTLVNNTYSSGNYLSWSPFTIVSGFASGNNYLDFETHNACCSSSGSPTGMRVELAGAACFYTAPTCCNVTPGPSYSTWPSGLTRSGSALLQSGILKLTRNFNGQFGAAKLPQFNGAALLHAFSAKFQLYMGGGTPVSADGFSFNLGDNLPAVISSGGEEGIGGAGLTVSFDTFSNGASDPIGIFLKDGGSPAGTGTVWPSPPGLSQGPGVTGPGWKAVEITMDSCGNVKVFYDGNLNALGHINYVPGPNARFALAARTGGLNDNHWVKDLVITTESGAPDITINTPPIQCCATVNYTAPCFASCANNLTIVCTPLSGTCFPVGVNRVCCTATDSSGNQGHCGFNVIVKDVTPPVLDCSQVPTLSSSGCIGVVPDYRGYVTASDNCPLPGPVFIMQSPTPGTAVMAGATTVTLKVCDASGNCTSCSTLFTVTAPLKNIPGVFSTGVDYNNVVLSVAGTPDPHYTGTVGLNGPAFTPLVIDPPPFGANWVPNDAFAMWIGPDAGGGNLPSGVYVYRLSFYLPPGCEGSARLIGHWDATADTATPAEMWLNTAHQTAFDSTGPTSPTTSFTLNSGFVAGMNTLEFRVPTVLQRNGLRVRFTRAVHRCCECGVEPPWGLVLWTPFDEPNTTAVAHNVAGGNNGAYFGPFGLPTVNPNGYVDRSLCFNGVNQFVRVPWYSAIDITTGNFSIDAWVKRDAGDAGIRHIVDHRSNPGTGLRGYALYLNSGVLTFEMRDAGGGIVNQAAQTVPADGNWHFVAVAVKRNSNQTGPLGMLFVDAFPVVTFNPTPASGSLANGSSLTLGARNDPPFGAQEVFKGCIDEVEIFNREVGSFEFSRLRQQFQQGKCKHCCMLPNVGFCPTDQSLLVTATLCNKSASPETYTYGVAGLLPGYPLTGWLNFGGVPATTATVPPWTCTTISFTVPRPPGLAWNKWGTIQLLAQANTSGEMTMGRAKVFDRSVNPWDCLHHVLDPSIQKLVITEASDVNRGRFRFGEIPLTNPFDTNFALQYRFRVEGPDQEDDTNVISLFGLPPGTVITNSFALAPGESFTTEINGQFLQDDPNQTYRVWIEGRESEAEEWGPLGDYVVTGIFQSRMEIISQEVDGIPRPAVSSSGFGTLQSAPALDGPWTDLPEAANPYVILPGGGHTRFYRLRQ